MKLGVPRERSEGENRVGLVPETVARLARLGFEVLVETGAGREYNPDSAYAEAGARVLQAREEVYGESDAVIKVLRPSPEEAELMREGQLLVCFLNGPMYPELVERLAARGVTVFSLEAIPRISRAQSMDALSSMSSIAGYKSVLLGANALGKYLPMMTTAAGTTRASKVLVLGAGVAGLQAIATAGRLGAEVTGFDVRPEVKEQVESLGARFLEPEREEPEEEEEPYEEYEPKGLARIMVALGFNSFAEPPEEREKNGRKTSAEAESMKRTGGYATLQPEEKQRQDRELIRRELHTTDLVITTAQIPGRRAPILITREMAEEMAPGSVIVDLAAESGGNCELTEAGKTVEHRLVKIMGPVNVPGMMPIHASQLYSRNMENVIKHLAPEGELSLDFEDEITASACIAHAGKISHAPTREALERGRG
ncbi:NAD(P) transhydrogenase subunit alpha [Rubrobacter calidifluminis]|uniref:NAD(P) transhydrogenase subunit alpha n=1 Tax=Rubrobacter calidifluminis TaxID=1392640 RepID=UPI00235E042B|nr:NAD(P) transhydrogenase subunit alpha [Rubrobacter calidifluminis]